MLKSEEVLKNHQVRIINKKVIYGSDLDLILSEPTLYYPGAGDDIGPFTMFTQNALLTTVVYVDYYHLTAKDALSGLANQLKGYEVVKSWPIEPQMLGCNNWEDFWPLDPESMRFGNPRNAFGKLLKLYNKKIRKTVNFIYLCTEAVQTYEILFSNRKKSPFAVVLQDHGKGGLWTTFQGIWGLYKVARKALPKFLYSQDAKEWPDYEQISDFGPPEGMHGYCRCLWERQEDSFFLSHRFDAENCLLPHRTPPQRLRIRPPSKEGDFG